jgi:selenocysteine lyase/cysteine desulfurase
LQLRDRGYDVRTVTPRGDAVPVESYRAVIDGGTRLITASAVHSASGYRTDLAALAELAAECGARLFVDACQAAGAVAIDVKRDRVDFLAAASHKFLLGSRGMGYLYVRRALLDGVRPVNPGWKAARKPHESFYGPAMDLSPTASKLDTSLPWFAALAEQAALGLFRRFGMAAIVERNARLTRRLRDALIARGFALPPFSASHDSTIVPVPVADADKAMARLRAAGVIASSRAGRVRLAVHFYNLEHEIDRVAELLSVA